MKIDTSHVSLTASHRAVERTEVRETMRAWVGDQPPAPDDAGASPSVVALSAAALIAAQAAEASTPPPVADTKAVTRHADNAENDPVLYFIKLMIEAMTGVKIKTVSASDMQPEQPPAEVPDAPPPQKAGFGIEYDRHEVREEHEHTTFHGEAVVRTSDGKELRLAVSLDMQRHYREESSTSLRAGDAVRKDPLVINFDGTAAQLQSTRFRFDLDGDGSKEQVPLLAGNRGYLALDRNGNGKVDSGKELFGPSSGDGFSELAQYDSDSNGWIDENDPVFGQLRVWMQDGRGEGVLASAQEMGVGALFLGRTDTPFALKDGDNRDLGAVRTTGLYLSEKGSAGTLQQIDLMV